MTVPASLYLAGALMAAAILAVLAALARRRARRLEHLVADADVKLERLQQQFERFVPAEVVERLTGERAAFTPSRRQVTILFADLRGFTAMCDHLDPGVVVTILNGYFERMNEAIVGHHGHITELVGDGLLALFGALEPNPWQASDSVLAALAMRAELARYNEHLRSRALPELRFGVGIHSGEVVAGVMGTGELSKFGVAGDPINVASRVEGLTRVHGVDLLITEEIRAALKDRFRLREMPAAQVKGKVDAIVTYHVEGLAQDPPSASPPGKA
jgi:adenylate cyclase